MIKAHLPALRVLPLVAALVCALALPHVPPSSARQTEARGLGVVHIRAEDGKEVKLYDKSFALVIGVSDYAAGWPKLPGVKRDIEEVARALELHGFQVTKVENPDSAQLDKAFKAFIDEHGLGVENRLLFYFAGHGHTIKQSYGEEMGYIVPADAPLPARDRAGFMSKAMDMEQMQLYARRIQSKHALFVFDSCFSGALFALSRAVPDSIGYKTARPVRQFITSGSADEQVPDHSIFRRQFVEALEGEADANRDGYVTGAELGEFLQDRVVNYSRNAQHPQYGKIRNPNLDKGDFVFALPRKAAPPAAAVAVKPNAVEPSRADPLTLELALWDAIKNSSDAEDFREYVSKYPSGQFAGVARRRIAALTANASPAPSGAASTRPAAPPPSRKGDGRPADDSARIEAANKKITADNETVARTFKEGNDALTAGRYDDAINAYGEALALRPDEPGLLINLSEAKRVRGAARFNAALKSRDVEAEEAAKKDWDEAAAHSREALRLLRASTPGDAAAQAEHKQSLTLALATRAEVLRLIALKVDTTQVTAAVTAIREYAAATTDAAVKSRLQVDMLELLFGAGDYAGTVAESEKLLAADPSNFNARHYLGVALYGGGFKARYQEAVDHLGYFVEYAPDTHPFKATIQNLLGYIKKTDNLTPRRTDGTGTPPR